MDILISAKGIDFTSPEVLAGFLATGILAIVGLLLTVFILKKILYKPLSKVISERQREADESLRIHEQNEQAMNQREAVLAEKEKQQADLLKLQREQAEKEIKLERDKMISEAKASAEALLSEAEQKIEQNRLNDENRVYRKAVELAVTTLGRLEERSVSPEESLALEKSIAGSLETGKGGHS